VCLDVGAYQRLGTGFSCKTAEAEKDQPGSEQKFNAHFLWFLDQRNERALSRVYMRIMIITGRLNVGDYAETT
jgi:hypothetical protein